MGKVAFLFPGQGPQREGLGADLRAQRLDLFERYFGAAEEASGLPLRQLCLTGPVERLSRADAAPPAVLALSLAMAAAAREADLHPEVVAGHSLGEFSAAVAAGSLAAADCMRLVARLGRLMDELQADRPGGMVAVIGLPPERVEDLCAAASGDGFVAPSSYNSPRQIVCSGDLAALDRLVALAERSDVSKVVHLRAGAAFHSELMRPVERELRLEMAGLHWRDPVIPMASSATGGLLESGEHVREALARQPAHPARWMDCARTVVGFGCDFLLELGPGRVLANVTRQQHPGVEAFSAESPARLAELAAEFLSHRG